MSWIEPAQDTVHLPVFVRKVTKLQVPKVITFLDQVIKTADGKFCTMAFLNYVFRVTFLSYHSL